MENFISAVQDTLLENHNTSITENGAVGYRTTGSALLDLNFSTASMRNLPEEEICNRFSKAFFEDKRLALKWLFFARDIRGGMGERRLFQTVLTDLAKRYPAYVTPLLDLVPEYGYWPDLWPLLDTKLRKAVEHIVSRQVEEDRKNKTLGKSISLLGKWLPSTTSRKKERRRWAAMLASALHLTNREYAHLKRDLNRYLGTVEPTISENRWGDVDYSAVPSKANLLYYRAFLRHDKDRREAFLEATKRGTESIHSGVLFPYEIVYKYRGGGYRHGIGSEDDTLEALWSALPDTVDAGGGTIVVMDDSGSMYGASMDSTNVCPVDVSRALAIYFAERMTGPFKDQIITFSASPQLMDISKGSSLYEKLNILDTYADGCNTNIRAVFELILETAVEHHMTQEDLPQNILIISDMEFDAAQSPWNGFGPTREPRWDAVLMETVQNDYAAHGYRLPRLVFWNVCSRTETIPMKQNELGVALVSGFSQNVASMVLSGELDPYKCLLEAINAPRYDPIDKALEPVLTRKNTQKRPRKNTKPKGGHRR